MPIRRARVDRSGKLTCRKCGSTSLLARGSEKGKRTKHLKCDVCGARQMHREPRHARV